MLDILFSSSHNIHKCLWDIFLGFRLIIGILKPKKVTWSSYMESGFGLGEGVTNGHLQGGAIYFWGATSFLEYLSLGGSCSPCTPSISCINLLCFLINIIHSVSFISNTANFQPVSNLRFSIVVACVCCLVSKKTHVCCLFSKKIMDFQRKTKILTGLFSKK